jgi:hypothetical protein
MAGAAPPTRLSWQLGTAVEIFPETPRVTSIVLELPQWSGHLAGQHVDVRLRDPSGSHLQRSYWIASAPADGDLVLTVGHRDDGEVSRYLAKGLRVGDQVELRGPLLVSPDRGLASLQDLSQARHRVPSRIAPRARRSGIAVAHQLTIHPRSPSGRHEAHGGSWPRERSGRGCRPP